jgi:hypothetical protein
MGLKLLEKLGLCRSSMKNHGITIIVSNEKMGISCQRKMVHGAIRSKNCSWDSNSKNCSWDSNLKKLFMGF